MDNQQLGGTHMKTCKECGKEIPERLTFCSRSCATRYNNKIRVQNGTLNLLSKNGGSELARRHNKEMSESGIHPFLKENFSEEMRVSNGKKHSEWVRNNQVNSNSHPWQLRNSRINNEYSREMSIYKNSNVKTVYLYIAIPKDFPNSIKIGVSRDLSMREVDSRFPISDVKELYRGGFEIICEMERELKFKFSSEDTFQRYGSYEIFDCSETEVYSEVQRLSEKSKEKSLETQTSENEEDIV